MARWKVALIKFCLCCCVVCVMKKFTIERCFSFHRKDSTMQLSVIKQFVFINDGWLSGSYWMKFFALMGRSHVFVFDSLWNSINVRWLGKWSILKSVQNWRIQNGLRHCPIRRKVSSIACGSFSLYLTAPSPIIQDEWNNWLGNVSNVKEFQLNTEKFVYAWLRLYLCPSAGNWLLQNPVKF